MCEAGQHVALMEDRDRDRQTDRERQRQTETETDRDREPDRERGLEGEEKLMSMWDLGGPS